MTWKHPAALWALLPLGALVFVYVAMLRRRPRRTVAFPLWLVAEAAARARPLRRHLPAAVFLLALAAAVIGTAGPVVPWRTQSGLPVVLVIDISRSMEEPDIPPSRIEATKTAALEFVRRLPGASKAAVVTFGNYATTVVPLTADRERLQNGIRNLRTQLRTQLGTGLVEGVRAVVGEGDAAAPPGVIRAVAVLLSDGRASDGIPPLEAAQEARRKGVRVYTVGVGTARDPSTFRSGYWGVLDEPTLRAMATETGGQYFRAAEAGQLRTIYRDLARIIGWEWRPRDATTLLGALALTLLIGSVALRFWTHAV